MRVFEATVVTVFPQAFVALCCVLLGCGCASTHHDAMKDGAKDAGGMNAAGSSGKPHDAGSSTAPPDSAKDASPAADAMTAAMHDASAPADAAAPLSACAKRMAVCEPGQVPQAKAAVGEAFRSCALAMTVMPCGVAVATFDAEGCAESIVVKIGGTANDALAKCVADKLAARRFQCAAAMDITFSASCT
jgi:hypothetical protein